MAAWGRGVVHEWCRGAKGTGDGWVGALVAKCLAFESLGTWVPAPQPVWVPECLCICLGVGVCTCVPVRVAKRPKGGELVDG